MSAYFIHFGHWQYVWDPQASWNSIFPCPTHSFMIKYLLNTLFSVLSRHCSHWNFPLFQWHQFFGCTQTKLQLFFLHSTVDSAFFIPPKHAKLLCGRSWVLELSRPGYKPHFYRLLLDASLNLKPWASVSLSKQCNSLVRIV